VDKSYAANSVLCSLEQSWNLLQVFLPLQHLLLH